MSEKDNLTKEEIMQNRLKELYTGNPEWDNWCELYEYIKLFIFDYEIDMNLPKYMTQRLKGLRKGVFMVNKRDLPYSSYDFKTILYTFKAYRHQIQRECFTGNQSKWKNEQHKWNYVMKIIENNINDIVLRLKNAKKAKEKTENLELKNQTHEGAEYKRKSKDIKDDTLNELW